MESTIGLYKSELIDRQPRTWSGVAEVERETASWIDWYNTTRIHNSISRMPPVEYEELYRLTDPAPTGEVA